MRSEPAEDRRWTAVTTAIAMAVAMTDQAAILAAAGSPSPPTGIPRSRTSPASALLRTLRRLLEGLFGLKGGAHPATG